MRVIRSVPAPDDLHAIDGWLSTQATPEIAARQLTAVRGRVTFLAGFPPGGRPLPDGPRVLSVTGTRYLVRHAIIDDLVAVLRIHNEREDWQIGT